MSKLSLPDSVKTYFNEKSLQTSIDSLVDRLDGKKMPESDWEQARSYNQALLMAAQIRADYVELMFGLWEETFGNSAAESLGSPFFDWDEDPLSTWENDYLRHSFYRDGTPQDEGKHEELYISFEEEFVCLEVHRFLNNETPLDFSPKCGLSLWDLKSDDGDIYARTERVPIKKFIANFDVEIAKLREAADEMVKYLLDH